MQKVKGYKQNAKKPVKARDGLSIKDYKYLTKAEKKKQKKIDDDLTKKWNEAWQGIF